MMEGAAILALLTGLIFVAKRKTKLLPPVHGLLTSPFGPRGNDFHNGIDIAVPVGSKVVAPADGVVINKFWNDRGGNQLIIDHGKGIVTGYAHLNGYNVMRGEKVKRGQVIAFSGNTGHSTGPHLHFTVTIAGKKVNPLAYLQKFQA